MTTKKSLKNLIAEIQGDHKSSLRDVVAQIQKVAKPPPPPPGNPPPKGPPPKPGDPDPKPKPTGGGGGGYSASAVNAIRDMQTAMQELAEAVIRDSASSTMGAKPKDQIQPEADQGTKTSKKSFNDFIAEQYVGSLDDDNKGVEWDKNPKVTTLPGKKQTQTDIYELDVVMNTFQRIGMEKSEFKPDGNWEFRTDNALRNMMGFAYALLQLEGDFGLPNNIYQYSNWKNFHDLMSGYKVENGAVKLSPADKETRAIDITKHLKAITKLYNHFRQQVTARPEYRPLIEGKRAFEKYNKAGSNKDALTPEEKKLTEGTAYSIPNLKYAIPGVTKVFTSIPLWALTSRDNYLKYMSDTVGVNEDQAIKLFGTIKAQIEAM